MAMIDGVVGYNRDNQEYQAHQGSDSQKEKKTRKNKIDERKTRYSYLPKY